MLAQLVERCTGVAEVKGLNTVQCRGTLARLVVTVSTRKSARKTRNAKCRKRGVRSVENEECGV